MAALLRWLHCADCASSIKGRGRAKEGCSVYGLLKAECQSSMGGKLLKGWIRKPLRNKAMLEERYDAIEYLLTPAASEHLGAISSHLRKSKNLRKIMLRVKQATSSAADFSNIVRTLQVRIGRYIHTVDLRVSSL